MPQTDRSQTFTAHAAKFEKSKVHITNRFIGREQEQEQDGGGG
jgi:hypothetical protein